MKILKLKYPHNYKLTSSYLLNKINYGDFYILIFFYTVKMNLDKF